MEHNFFVLFLAHITANFLFRGDATTLNKASFTPEGWRVCFKHSVTYTLIFYLFTFNHNYIFLLSVFSIHFIIDKINLAEIWLEIIKSRSLTGFARSTLTSVHQGVMLNGGFSVSNHIMTDMALHLVPIYFIYKGVNYVSM
jgi:hypothetical protein